MSTDWERNLIGVIEKTNHSLRDLQNSSIISAAPQRTPARGTPARQAGASYSTRSARQHPAATPMRSPYSYAPVPELHVKNNRRGYLAVHD